MKKIIIPAIFTLISAIALAPGPSSGQSPERILAFEPENGATAIGGNPAPEDLYYHPRKEFFYGENWHYLAKLDSGYVVYSNVFITNMGLTQPSCAVEFSIISPTGDIVTSKRDYKADSINASTDAYSIKVAANTVNGSYPNYRLHLDQDNTVVDLNFKNLLPGWKMNSGAVYFDKKKSQFWKYVVTSPSAYVTGSLTIGGKTIPVKGFGFQDHSLMNVAPTDFSTRWFHFRYCSDKHTVIFTEVQTSKAYTPNRIAMALVAVGDKIVYQGNNLQLNFGNFVKDNEQDYSYPGKIGATMTDGNFSLSGNIEVVRPLERVVVLAHLNPVLRNVVHSFVAKPVYYRSLNKFDFALKRDGKTENVSGEGLNEAVFIK